MPRIRIDIDQLAVALSDHELEWVLDSETGEILMAEWIRDPDMRQDLGLGLDGATYDDDGGLDEEPGGLDPLDSDRFLGIEPIESHEGFRWMEDFAERQAPHVRERLLGVLNRPRPFRRFKDALPAFPEVRDAWYDYEDRKLKECAREWVRFRELDAELFEYTPQTPS